MSGTDSQESRRDSAGRWVKGVSGNPRGAAKPKTQPRGDGFANVVTSLGTSRDKRLHAVHVTEPISDAYAVNLWRGNDIAARVIEELPQDAMRGGFELKIGGGDEGDKERAEAIVGRMEDLGAAEKVQAAAEYERAFGGGAVLIGVPDSDDMTKPLDEASRRGVRFLTALEARDLTPMSYYDDPLAPKFGEPEVYSLMAQSPGAGAAVMPGSAQVHESRLIIFPGIRVSRYQHGQRTGWGDSILTRVYGAIRDFGQTWESAAAIMQDFSQVFYKIKGLAELMRAEDGEKVAQRRLELIDLSRSLHRMMPIDAEDELGRDTMPLSGISDILDRMAQRLSAAAGMPITKLMGQSPAGMNATGESDMRNWYDQVAAYRRRKILPGLERIARLLLIEGGTEPDSWAVQFPPLWQPSDKEKADARFTQAQADAIYIDRGAPMMDFLRSRFGGDEYSHETQVDLEELEALERAALEEPESVPEPEPDPPGPGDEPGDEADGDDDAGDEGDAE